MEFSLRLVFTLRRNYSRRVPECPFFARSGRSSRRFMKRPVRVGERPSARARRRLPCDSMDGRVPIERLRGVVFVLVGAALVAAIWSQRSMVSAAWVEMRAMPLAVIVMLAVLTVAERATRADIVRRLLGPVTFGRALTIHDVGTAATKGVPLGGPLATALRWSIARDAAVPTTTFASTLVAYGVATTFVTWLLPLSVLLVELIRGSPDRTDVVLIGVCAAVVAASALFWTVVLGSERIAGWMARSMRRLRDRIAHRVPAVTGHDPGAALLTVRDSLRSVARRPAGLLARTVIAQACSAVILLVALRGLGVGAELATIEFFRVYFVVTLLSSFVPTPGGVGVVEAGLTGALVAAGVSEPTALAAVIVYRLLTYVTPIVVGALLYVAWRLGVRTRGVGLGASPVPARSVS